MSETPAEPDFDADPGLAPDPEHEVHENPPEGAYVRLHGDTELYASGYGD